jgi:hypothetical protein
MIKKTLSLAAIAVAGLLAASSVSAVTFTATGTGPVTAYFYGQSAGYGSDLGMWVNGVPQGIYGLQNHTVAPGTSLMLGNVNLGDNIVFELRVATGGGTAPPPISAITYSLFSDPSLNPYLEEHVLASAFPGGPFGIPAGTFVGFEDIIPLSASDLDYNDHQFVFTNVRSSVPDAGTTFSMLGLALGGLGMLRRKL